MRAVFSGVLAASVIACACGSGGVSDGGPLPVWDGGACPAGVVGQFPDASYEHVALGTIVDYGSNPPAGGDHYPYWATWGIHSDTVPSEYFVHNEEHGGVILLYNCTSLTADACSAIVSTLTGLVNAQPTDPICVAQQTGVPNRMVMTADPDIPGPVAAAAWGWYYNESEACVDVASLEAFITAHYGVGRLCPGLPDGGFTSCEPLCAQGAFQ